ncbi:hypothetical protein BZB76_0313 [Actinomadura pelletieri DSM 43383]|uniref:Uncharacterized protein n=1 Tax=Actinomadura pelletieri DSM 43383 TaxID=1120940 RepID=A0A495QXF7_9ACTN|nr:hypothetical protein [Actinomadura pelletieri]RKS78879.1 hypothetical protein BZB76_0313 [Actinomadura pelletieri DSM 43383]
MSAGRSITTLYFVVIGGTILIGLILFAPWPLWIPFIAIAALGGVLLYVVKATRRQRTGHPLPEPAFEYTSAPVADNRGTRLTGVLLPTSRPDYFFQFSAIVIWSPTSAADEFSINYAAVATDSVVKRACEVTEAADPMRASLVQHELASALGEMRTDATGRVRAMAESVRIVLPDRDRERLDKLAAVRKEEDIWEHERKHEQNKREYLGGDVLKDPGSAVVWWLARNNEQVEKTVNDIRLLALLSSAANNEEVPPAFRPYLHGWPTPEQYGPNGSGASPPEHGEASADGFAAFLSMMRFEESDPQRRLLARQAAEWAAMHGRGEIAEELIRRYDPPGDGVGAEEGGKGG